MTKSIFLIAIIYLILIALFFYFQRLLMYFPSQNLPNPNQVQLSEMKVIQLQTSDGLTLYSWYHKAKHNRKTIVYFHGNGGNIADRAIRVKPLLNAGMGLLMLNYRGYGDNEGKPSEKGLIKDAQSALNFLLNKENIELEKIILLGESLGTAMAIKLASENLVGAVILESPFISATEVG
ncbi:MAG: alpha/beta fold hydrolase, partial [Pseudomonadota bacterium]|nr:alpha/beta fold hydrolase [Pseudomonadota bacterium]